MNYSRFALVASPNHPSEGNNMTTLRTFVLTTLFGLLAAPYVAFLSFLVF